MTDTLSELLSDLDATVEDQMADTSENQPASHTHYAKGFTASREDLEHIEEKLLEHEGTYPNISQEDCKPDLDVLIISDADASFILGREGRTKRKLAIVCGADLNVTKNKNKDTVLEICGSYEARKKAIEYIGFVIQQRIGVVRLHLEPGKRNDLTIIDVPVECVGYVTGKKGSGLRSIEEEWKTLMFFTSADESPEGMESLAIFGKERSRLGAELKVKSAVEQKKPGYYTAGLYDIVNEDEGIAHDIMRISDENYSYALGKMGITRKKLAAASNALLEYVGPFAYIVGNKIQRTRAREYLDWLCRQRTQSVEVDTDSRDDVDVIRIPSNVVPYITGSKGSVLRQIEQKTKTFIFLDGKNDGDHARLLIFGAEPRHRQRAKEIVEDKIETRERSKRHARDSYYPRSRSRSYDRHKTSRTRRSRSYERGRRRRRSSSYDRRDDRRNRYHRSRRSVDSWRYRR